MTNPSSKPGEFDLIAKFFAPLAADVSGAYGLQDDAATIALPLGEEFVLTTDLLSANTHFFTDDPPDLIARKALRVNLSDLAAKGAKPIGYLLSLALARDVTTSWIESFASGLREDQRAFDISLFGGDTTATDGPATISITAFGTLPVGTMTKRSGAKSGDIVFITGTIGDAAAGLTLLRDRARKDYSEDEKALVERYRLPRPRIGLGQKLRGIATSALDVSDGLVGDLEHIAETSCVGVIVDADRIPISKHLRRISNVDQTSIVTAATGGDDYEIAFTAPASRRDGIQELAGQTQTPVTEIGRVESGKGVILLNSNGFEIPVAAKGYKHFQFD